MSQSAWRRWASRREERKKQTLKSQRISSDECSHKYSAGKHAHSAQSVGTDAAQAARHAIQSLQSAIRPGPREAWRPPRTRELVTQHRRLVERNACKTGPVKSTIAQEWEVMLVQRAENPLGDEPKVRCGAQIMDLLISQVFLFPSVRRGCGARQPRCP